jgi:methionine synthase I (cobalamin-dependent)
VELNEAGARLATGVRDREYPGRWVAGDIGPCGAMVKPMGNAEPEALRVTFAEQARALVAGGVDLLNIETMFDLTEATIAVEEAVAAAALLARGLSRRDTASALHVCLGMARREADRVAREVAARGG